MEGFTLTKEKLNEHLGRLFSLKSRKGQFEEFLVNTNFYRIKLSDYIVLKSWDNDMVVKDYVPKLYKAYGEANTEKVNELSKGIRQTFLDTYFQKHSNDDETLEYIVSKMSIASHPEHPLFNKFSLLEQIWGVINGFIFGFLTCDEIAMILKHYSKKPYIVFHNWEYYLQHMITAYPAELLSYFEFEASETEHNEDGSVKVSCPYLTRYELLRDTEILDYFERPEETNVVTSDQSNTAPHSVTGLRWTIFPDGYDFDDQNTSAPVANAVLNQMPIAPSTPAYVPLYVPTFVEQIQQQFSNLQLVNK